jgi:hypothetical protein
MAIDPNLRRDATGAVATLFPGTFGATRGDG